MSIPPDEDLEALAETVRSRSRAVAVSDVVTLLATTEPSNRATVTTLLVATVEGDPSRAREAIEDLGSLLDRPDADLRSEAATAIRHVATESPRAVESAIEPLVECLHDDAPLVRLNAAAALSVAAETYPTAVEAGVPALCDLLDSDLPMLRVHATSTIQTIAASRPETVAPISSALLDAVASRSTDFSTVHDGDDGTPLAEGGSAEIEDRLRRFEADTREMRTVARRNAAAALVEVARENADTFREDAGRLIDAAEREFDPTVCASLLTLLGFVAERHPLEVLPAIDVLVECLQEAGDDALVGKAAWVCSLLADAAPERVGDELQPALPAIIDALDATPAAQVPSVSLLAYVGEQHPAEVAPARPALRDLLDSEYPSARTGAALTLGFVGDDATLPALRTARDDDPRRNVRRAAEKSIQLIEERL